MSLLDNASLLLTPNAYKEGKLYSVIPSNGNGDFTATRATTATRVNSAGLVDLVPYNLVQYSEMFSDAIWNKTRTSITANTITAPNGTLTADTLTLASTPTSTTRSIQQTTNSTNLTNTASIYLKYSDRQFIQLVWGSAFNITNYVNIDVLNGTITQGVYTSATIESVGSGWYRVSLTTIGATLTPFLYIWPIDNGTDLRTANSSGTGSYYIWGAQIVEGTSARDYLRTETRLNIPRVDYSLGGCPSILLEPQRTNLALQSSSFDNASWTKISTSITANSTTSPSGIVDADTYIGSGATSQKFLFQNASITSGTTYTMSVYAKKNTNNFLQLAGENSTFGLNVWANFDLNNGLVGSTGLLTTARIENAGNGWYRCTITGAATATITSGAFVMLLVNSATSIKYETNSLSTSVFLWGAQFEVGAYATSYIPTTTASVTRNADSITRNNIFTNGLITAAGGTWFVELRNNVALVGDGGQAGSFLGDVNNGFLGNCFIIRYLSTPVASQVIAKRVGGVFTNLYTTLTDTAKIAIKWNGTTADIFVNGVKVVSATTFTTTNMEFLNAIGGDSARNINEMALFPTPLTDAQCLALTA